MNIKIYLPIALLLLAIVLISPVSAQTCSGGTAIYTTGINGGSVPANCYTATITVNGAAGGGAGSTYSSGGNGGQITGVFSVNPGTTFNYAVGAGGSAPSGSTPGTGGSQDGAAGGSANTAIANPGGGGGGITAISFQSGQIIMAGAGGGAGGGHGTSTGGAGGGIVGSNGIAPSNLGIGIGGSHTAGGSGGTSSFGGPGGSGSAYSGGSGGTGVAGSYGVGGGGGGGGGAGYYGGGGGAGGVAAGGGGGSSYESGATSFSYVTGGGAVGGTGQGANGNIIITWSGKSIVTLTESASPSIGGTVTQTTSSGSYLMGNSVTITATPNSGWYFSGWSGTGSSSYSGPNNVETFTISNDITETTSFVPNVILMGYSYASGQAQYGASQPANGTWSMCLGVLGVEYPGGNPSTCTPTGAGTIASLNINSITYGGAVNYLCAKNATKGAMTFLGWFYNNATYLVPIDSGSVCPQGIITPINIVGPTAIVAEFASPSSPVYSITTNAVPSGGGTVSPVSGNILVAAPTTPKIQISETPNSGYTFTGWSCTPSSACPSNNPTQVITISGSTVVTADFSSTAPPPSTYYNLIIPSGTGGTTNPSAGTYSELSNSAPTINAIANSGYTFSGWICTNGISSTACTSQDTESTSNNLALSAITGNIIETASFTPISSTSYNVIISAGPGGTASPVPGTYSEVSESMPTINAIPYTGNVFKNWTCTNGISSSACTAHDTESTSNNLVLSSLTGNITETANFQQAQIFTFNVISVPANASTVSPGNSLYLQGNSFSITATPATGYNFQSWSCTGSGCNSSTNNPANVIMNGNIVETANFQVSNALTVYTLNEEALPAVGGDVFPGSGKYLSGNTFTITAITNTSYSFQSWSCAAQVATGLSDKHHSDEWGHYRDSQLRAKPNNNAYILRSPHRLPESNLLPRRRLLLSWKHCHYLGDAKPRRRLHRLDMHRLRLLLRSNNPQHSRWPRTPRRQQTSRQTSLSLSILTPQPRPRTAHGRRASTTQPERPLRSARLRACLRQI